MPGFLYYLPGANSALLDLAAARLLYAIDPKHKAVRACRGPDGKGGAIVADARHVERVGYYPDEQEWREAPGGKVWVGRAKGEAIGPEDLAREMLLDGHRVVLEDRNEWLVPLARAAAEQDGDLRWYCPLPARLTLRPDGKWAPSDPAEQYRHLWDIATRWVEAKCNAEVSAGGLVLVGMEFTSEAVTALRTNYRVGDAEADMLGLFYHDTPVRVLDALIDWPRVVEYLQKKTR